MMRTEVPIFRISSFTPSFGETGLFAASSSCHGGPDAKAVWVHGVLVIGRKGQEESWAKSISLTVVSEANQQPRIVNLVSRRTLLENHFRDAEVGGEEVRVLPFSVNVNDALGETLYDDSFYVHLSARQLASEPLRIEFAESGLPSYLGTEMADSGFAETDDLIKAYDAASAGRYGDAVEYFERALENVEIRSDLDRSNLFNAAFCAGRAIPTANSGESIKALRLMEKWAVEDIRLRTEKLAHVQSLFAAQAGKSAADRLNAKRAQLFRDLGVALPDAL